MATWVDWPLPSIAWELKIDTEEGTQNCGDDIKNFEETQGLFGAFQFTPNEDEKLYSKFSAVLSLP